MGVLSHMPLVVLLALMSVFFLAAFTQAVHALFIATRREVSPARVIFAYEMLIVVHLVLACCTANSASRGFVVLLAQFRPYAFPLDALLWVNLAIAAFGLALAIAKRRPVMTLEIVLIALCTPPIISLLGDNCVYLFILDAAFFLFRTSAGLVLDIRHVSDSITQLSLIGALDNLPEGLVWANGNGRIQYMNDAMRADLTSLGFATDLSETSGLWADLGDMAREKSGKVLPEGIRLEVSPDKTCLFMRDKVSLRGVRCRRLVAVDVTGEEALNRELEEANGLLRMANDELRESLAHVQSVAQDEAIVRMKARVHDTIGQRLSILHRFLEAENPTPEALGEVKRLAGSIVDDLSEPETPDRASQLDSIVGAFALIGIEVCVKGSLPEDDDAASVFVNIVREAATNAAKHAQAKHVDVNISRIGNVTLLRVVNDGMPAPANLRMGCGIPGMRRAAEAIGGTFGVSSNDPFTIEVHLERPESEHAPSVRAVYEKELS